jgi:hypothetical protein
MSAARRRLHAVPSPDSGTEPRQFAVRFTRERT